MICASPSEGGDELTSRVKLKRDVVRDETEFILSALSSAQDQTEMRISL